MMGSQLEQCRSDPARRRTAALAAVFALLGAGSAVAQCAAYPNSPPGTKIPLGDEDLRVMGLPFPFTFHGITYDAVTVCSNGYLWLGSGGTSDYLVSEAEALLRGPRIMPLWADLDPASFGAPADSGVYWRADTNQVSVIWRDVRTYGDLNHPARMECSLEPSGRITFRYEANHSQVPVVSMAGITAGNGAAPNARSWSSDLPGPTAILGATGYEIFGLLQINMMGRTVIFTPRSSPPGNIDYDVTTAALPPCPPGTYPPMAGAVTNVGAGCPATLRNGAIYESFTLNSGSAPLDLASKSIEFRRNGDSYSWGAGVGFDPTYAQTGTAIAMTDDQVVHGLSFGAMGSFPFGSQVHTAVAVCANGYAWLPDGLIGDFTPTTTELLDRAPRLAPLWMDHDPSTGGTFYWENSDPLFCRATFASFRERGQTGTNTFQMTLRSNGDIVFSYGPCAGGVANTAVVGISGGGAADGGASNFVAGGNVTTGARRITGAVSAMQHTVESAPRLGLPFRCSSTVPPENPGLGMFALGVTNPGLPLDLILGPGSAPGCTLYNDLQWTSALVFPPGAESFALQVAVPHDRSLAGLILFSQAGALSTRNAAGILTSNGLRFTTGL